MIHVITFDLDDTLWDVRPALMKAERAQNTWLQAHYPQAMSALDTHALNQRKKALIQQQPELIHHISRFRQVFLEHLLLDSGVAPAEAKEAALQAFAEFIARRNDVALFEHSLPVLRALQQHYVLAALTNGNADVTKTPLARFFSFALKAEDVGAAKPEPDLFWAAMARAGVSAEQMVHVGDSHEHDIIGAQAAGLRSIWLSHDPQPSPVAIHTIQCLSELPGVINRLA